MAKKTKEETKQKTIKLRKDRKSKEELLNLVFVDLRQ